MNLYDIASVVSEFSLVVHRNNDKNELYIARPAEALGSPIRFSPSRGRYNIPRSPGATIIELIICTHPLLQYLLS